MYTAGNNSLSIVMIYFVTLQVTTGNNSLSIVMIYFVTLQVTTGNNSLSIVMIYFVTRHVHNRKQQLEYCNDILRYTTCTQQETTA